ncbi:predicted transcriptional regulator [Paenibacillus popilliae ATCC 14706]|uniref:Predicted transcriptional regulator n=2 Tax=Paenibacillus popilliae TaxID=78057 RepID=M9LRU7_PAEPP|nr:predicted transcriptional regulator [Paenibacillus popilliae ATCC 14706]
MQYLYVRKERKQRKWTQKFVAKQLGLSKTAVHDLEKGKQRPSYDVFVALEDLFQLPHRYLLAQEGKEVPIFSCYCKNLDSFILAR